MTIQHSPAQAHATALRFAANTHGHRIGGNTVGTRGKTLAVYDPGNGTMIGAIAAGNSATVDQAVDAARSAFDRRKWLRIPAPQRAQIIWNIGDLIDAHRDELTAIEALDNGMPCAAARAHVINAGWAFRYHAGFADKVFGHSSSLEVRGSNYLGYTLREPVGVVAMIVPWNAPLRQTVYKLAPALAAGCTMVLKPAAETSLTALFLATLIEQAGVPAGVVNVVTGDGERAGAPLAEHSGVDKVSFTGSTRVGHAIIHASAHNLKRLTLELGGKSPLLLFEDADMRQAVGEASVGIFDNAGQICSAASRLLVQRSIHDEVVDAIAAIGRSLKLGYHTDAVDMGPLISEKQHAHVTRLLESGISQGAEVVGTPDNAIPETGYYLRPTVLSAVTPEMTVFNEEIFGPVLAVTAFDDESEAVALANRTRYGLAASVFTRNVARAHRVAAGIRAGRVGINAHLVTDLRMPGGGFKESGVGRENGPDPLAPYLELKSVFTRTD